MDRARHLAAQNSVGVLKFNTVLAVYSPMLGNQGLDCVDLVAGQFKLGKQGASAGFQEFDG
jgi:hypothetical protein